MFFRKKNNNKILFILSPSDFSPRGYVYPSVPLLAGQLKQHNYEVIFMDFVNSLYHDIRNLDFLKKILDRNIKTIKEKDRYYTVKQKLNLKQNYDVYHYLVNIIKESKDDSAVEDILNNFIQFGWKYKNDIYNKNYNSIKKQCFDKKSNFFISYFEDKIKKIPKDIDRICISIYPGTEIYPILTLSAMLKKKYKNKKIILGGYWFGYIKDEIQKHEDFFEIFCDYLIVGEGENAIVEMMKYLDGEIDISEVSNLMYKSENNTITFNEKFSNTDINKVFYADYDILDFNKYKKKSISMMLSKGCYWGKCRFCTYSQSRDFHVKSIENVLNEIKYYIQKYNINFIYFEDDAIPPLYYYQLSKKILEEQININFSSFAIFDEKFTYDVLKTCYDAGLRDLTWGLETNSKKVFDIINKSGCFEKRAEILKNSAIAGINNKVNVIEGLPGEQFEDLIQTVKFLHDNADYIRYYSYQPFQQRVGSEFSNNPTNYGLVNISKEEFSLYFNFINNNTDINYNNSFLSFQKNCKLPDNVQPETRDALKIITSQYLKKHAPDLL